MSKKSILKNVILCSLILPLASCTTSGGYYFNGVESEGTTQTELRGKTYELATTDAGIEYMAYAQPTYDGDEVQVSIGIANSTDEDFYFSDSSLELFRGNYETGEWHSLGKWDAKTYYQEVYNKLKTQETLTAVAGALSVASSAMGTTSRSRVSTSRGTSYVTTHTYSPAMTGLTALAASASLNSLVTSNKLTLDILESSLLYSSNIAAKNNYTGNVYLDADNSSPDYKVTLSNDDGTSQDFIFSRSDRYEVLHPWSDQSKDRHSITFSHSIADDRMQLTYFWSRKKGIGAYTGISLYNIFQSHEENAPGYFYSSLSTWDNFTFHIDPDTTDSWTSSTRYDGHVELSDYIYSSIGIPIGINYRILPNIWITAGVDFIINLTAWAEGTIQYKNPNGKIYDYPGTYWFEDFAYDNVFDFGLQAGINAITNFLDFNIGITYVLPDKFYFDVGAGFVL